MKLVEYQPGARVRATALAVFISTLVLLLAVAAFRLFAGLTISGTVTVELITFILLFSTLFLVRKKRILPYALIVLCLIINTALFLLHNDGTEYRYPSPNRTSTIVIREKSALTSTGWAEVYRRKYGIFLQSLDVYLGTGDAYHPFPSGQHRVAWSDEHTALLTYYDGTQYREITLTV